MLPLRNAIPCLYFRLKKDAEADNFPDDYEDGIPFSGVFGNADSSMGNSFENFHSRNYSYVLETHNLKLSSRDMKPDDIIYANTGYSNGAPILQEDAQYRVINFAIGEPRVNFRDQKRNEEEAPKRLYLR